ncbi:MAG: tetratricopeptide repeat protein, partial [Rhodospirillales bacterium]|nr:tetratricopeptide repeat protein [Rhodospirillales bacterium]
MPSRNNRSGASGPAARYLRAGAVLAAMTLALGGCVTTEEEPLDLAPPAAASDVGPRTIVLAERAIAEGRYGDAGRLLERAVLADPENARAKLLRAEVFLATGANQRALEYFGELAGHPEVGAQALQGEGIALTLLGDAKLGTERLGQAVEADPSLWRAWNALGSHYDTLGDWEAATASYDKALAVNPNSAFVYNNRGYSMLMQARWDEAVKDLSKAVLIDQDFELARSNLRLALA